MVMCSPLAVALHQPNTRLTSLFAPLPSTICPTRRIELQNVDFVEGSGGDEVGGTEGFTAMRDGHNYPAAEAGEYES